MALRVAARRAGMGEFASALKKGVDDLCLELRRVLAGEGKDVVSRKFDPSLLGRPLEELFEACRGAAERLVEATGSVAGARILEVLEGYRGVAGGGRGG